MRKSGVILPISSLPSKYGIGTFSKSAYEFVDKLQEAGQKLWQLLPLGPTGYGDSPYQSFSTFAGNPYFIDLDVFIEKGWLLEKECLKYKIKTPEKVDYEEIYNSRFKLLRIAYKNSGINEDADFSHFVKENADWLKDYALYMAVKKVFQGVSWLEWDEPIKYREKNAIKEYELAYKEEIQFFYFQQYFFNKQWKALKKYANQKGIEIVGDIPIYVALDSADTWANASLFQLDSFRKPSLVAGCPPDAFSDTGQLWGNPLYDWKQHKASNYEWWLKRIAYCFDIYDMVRIDHFRGFDAYYAIPYGDSTAENGKWKKGPGYDFFAKVRENLGDKPIIAEDLGFLTPSVHKLLKKCKYPGMRILQFAFDAANDSTYLPHNAIKNCIMYTGTHDNDTIIGWYETLANPDKQFAKEYAQVKKNSTVAWDLIRLAIASVADTAIVPMQDYLGLGHEARINFPSTLGGNWEWRMKEGSFTEELAKKMRKLVTTYKRC